MPVMMIVVLALVVFVTYGGALAKKARTKRLHQRACSLLMNEFVVIDLETTGLDPAKHAIIEIGAIRVTPDVVAERTQSARPGRPS